jgi:FkbM family methyltransferase
VRQPKFNGVQMKKKLLFTNDWHNGDIHMSRPYVMDIMSFVSDCDFYYFHKNNKSILEDIQNLNFAPDRFDADIVVNTWIGQYLYAGRAELYSGCNFQGYHQVMTEVYRQNGWSDRLKDVTYYTPHIDYKKLKTAKIDAFFRQNQRPSILICNNETKSGQSQELDFPKIIRDVALARPEANVFVTNPEPLVADLPNVLSVSNFTHYDESGFDLNEISYLSTFTQLIFGRSSGPYSFSVVDENIVSNRFVCVTNSVRDVWNMPGIGYVVWTNTADPAVLVKLVLDEFDKAKSLQKQKNMFFGQFNPPVDFYIKQYFPEGYVGRCIEVGAVDGVFLSNTYHFELNGWECLCVEPIPKYFESLEKNRKNAVRYAATNENSDNREFTVFTMANANQSSVSGLAVDNRLLVAHEAYRPVQETISVKTRRLDWIIDNHFKGGAIDFISIDTEGNELDVLKSIDLDAYDVKLLIVENNYNDPVIEQYLSEFGWRKDKRVEVNDFYIKGVK